MIAYISFAGLKIKQNLMFLIDSTRKFQEQKRSVVVRARSMSFFFQVIQFKDLGKYQTLWLVAIGTIGHILLP